MIELTNTSGASFAGTSLDWCRPFNCSVLETDGFAFSAGETRTYVIGAGLSTASADDLWVNRLIGDEQHPSDVERADNNALARWPEWFVQGHPARRSNASPTPPGNTGMPTTRSSHPA